MSGQPGAPEGGRGVPRLARALLRLVIRDGDILDGILGDLGEEEEEALGAGASPLRRWLWHWTAVLGLTARFLVAGARKRSAVSRSLAPASAGRERGRLEGVGRDLLFAMKRLRRRPGFTATTVLILTLGLGGTTAIFTVVNGVLVKPLPYRDPEGLVGVWYTAPGWQMGGFPGLNISPAGYFTYREESRTLEDIAVWDSRFLTVMGAAEAERVPAMIVTDGLFGVLGVEPILGRGFSREDDTPGTPLTVVLSEGYWQRRFAGDRGVVGRVIAVDGEPHEVIGVLPRGFTILSRPADLYVPARFERARVDVGDFSYQAIGRMRPGATVSQVRDDVARMIPLSIERFPGGITAAEAESAGLGAEVHPLRDELVADVETALWFLLGAMAVVLAIACANVANLVLVQADGREREVAVRTALGAGRGRVALQLFLESLILGLFGAAGGLALTRFSLAALRRWGPQELPRLQELGLDPVVVGFAVLLALLASVVFGLLPALRSSRGSVTATLRDGGRTASRGRRSTRARNGFVVSQVAFALLLLVASGLMARSFRSLLSLDPGFRQPESVLTFRVNLPEGQVSSPEDVALFHETIVGELRRLPGVASATGTNSLPMDGWDSNQSLFIEDFPTPEGEQPPGARVKWVGGEYFATLGIGILAGRDLTWADTRERRAVVAVNEAYARAHWGDPARARGRRIAYERGTWYEIVGVTANTYDNGLDRPAIPVVYWPVAVPGFWGNRLWVPRWFAYVVRTAGPRPMDLVRDVREIVRRANPDVPVFNIETLATIRDRSVIRTSFTAGLLGVASLIAVLLAVVGVYGVIACGVALRTREIGVRLALGADRAGVRGMVLRDGLALVGTGVILGLAGAVALTRFMTALLFRVHPVDAVTYAAAAALLVVVATAATWLPALGASRVDPVEALRAE